jgi:hypothetical protein
MKYAWLALAVLVLADFLVWASRERPGTRPVGPPFPPLYQAILDGDVARVKSLATKENVSKDEKPYGTPLVFAATYGNLKTIPTLIEAGADANDRSMPFGATALGAVVGRRDVEATGWLLLHGADPDAPCGLDGDRPHVYVYEPEDRELSELLTKYQDGKYAPHEPPRPPVANRWEMKRMEEARKVRALLQSRGGRNGS